MAHARLRPPILLALASTILFAADAVLVETGTSKVADRALELDVHRGVSRGWKTLMDAFSLAGNTGEVAVACLLIVLVLLLLRAYRSALVTACVPFLAAGLGSLLKLIFMRPRPHLWSGVQHISSYSFPSGHATASGALACVLTWLGYRHLGKRIGAVVGVVSSAFALGVGFSRIYLGVHWPTDVFGGYMVALFTIALSVAATQNWRTRG